MAKQHIMVDIETLGTRAYSVILSIGAVAFNFDSPPDLKKSFYRNIELSETSQSGRTITYTTVGWWFQQPDNAIKGLLTPKPVGLREALVDFEKFIHKNLGKKCAMWANGATFDLSILRNVLEQHKLSVWHYRQEACMRTLRHMEHLVGLKWSDESTVGIKHNALDDAIRQATYVCKFGGLIKGNEGQQ